MKILCIGGPKDGARIKDIGQVACLPILLDSDPLWFIGKPTPSVSQARYNKVGLAWGKERFFVYLYDGTKEESIFPMLLAGYRGPHETDHRLRD